MPAQKTVTYTVYTIEELRTAFPEVYRQVIARYQNAFYEFEAQSYYEDDRDSCADHLKTFGYRITPVDESFVAPSGKRIARTRAAVYYEEDYNRGQRWSAFGMDAPDAPTLLNWLVGSGRLSREQGVQLMELVEHNSLTLTSTTKTGSWASMNSDIMLTDYEVDYVRDDPKHPLSPADFVLMKEFVAAVDADLQAWGDTFIRDFNRECEYRTDEEYIHNWLLDDQALFLANGDPYMEG